MRFARSRRLFIRACAASWLGVVTGCGMLMHPERRNQPTGGGVDWTVFALDTVGLLLFFIPGVIAFAVDFTTGAIYLPPHPEYGDCKPPANEPRFVTVQVPRIELNERRLAKVASQLAGRDVRLVAGEYRTAPLTKLDDFWATREQLAAVRG